MEELFWPGYDNNVFKFKVFSSEDKGFIDFLIVAEFLSNYWLSSDTMICWTEWKPWEMLELAIAFETPIRPVILRPLSSVNKQYFACFLRQKRYNDITKLEAIASSQIKLRSVRSSFDGKRQLELFACPIIGNSLLADFLARAKEKKRLPFASLSLCFPRLLRKY